MEKNSINLLSRSSKSIIALNNIGWCDACGGYGPYQYKSVVTTVLARQWKLSAVQREAMNARESMACAFCGSTYRLRLLSRAINYWNSGNAKSSLLQNIESGKFDDLKVAEINSCGVLHDILKKIPHLKYSEYGSTDTSVPDEDLQSLSYGNNMFDMVLTSDVLEHVPDVDRALKETYRVLKPGGVHIMSVPIIRGRSSRKRTHMTNKGKAVHDLAASFHGSGEPDYLVWSEFGDDFVSMVENAGFNTYALFVNDANKNDASGIILAVKADKGASQKLKSIPRKDIQEDGIDLEWQASRVGKMIEKQKLSENHIHNIENILNEYKREREEIRIVLEQYEKDHVIQGVLRGRRLARQIKEIIRK